MEHIKKQIQGIEGKINRLQHRLTRGRAALAALKTIRMRLLKTRERIEADDLEEAVDSLEDASQEIQDQLEDLNGPTTTNILKTIHRLEAKIHILSKTARGLEKRGHDTSTIDGELAVMRHDEAQGAPKS